MLRGRPSTTQKIIGVIGHTSTGAVPLRAHALDGDDVVRINPLQSDRVGTCSMHDTPRIEGLTHTIIHPGSPEDVPWIAVRSQRNADGSESHVWERWVAFSVEPLYLALYAKWDPGMIVRRHGHHSPHTITVLAGEFTCGDELCGVGTHIELPYGAAFGPFVAGPAGVELYEVMMGDPRSWSDEPEVMQQILRARGVEQLPDPPIELPAGLEDLRAVFSAGASARD